MNLIPRPIRVLIVAMIVAASTIGATAVVPHQHAVTAMIVPCNGCME